MVLILLEQSHFQATGSDQVATLELELQRLGFRSWCVWGLVRGTQKPSERARTLAARRLLTYPVAVPHTPQVR